MVDILAAGVAAHLAAPVALVRARVDGDGVREADGGGDLSAAEQMVVLNKFYTPSVKEPLKLNAYLRCMDAETAMLSDAVRRNDPDAKSKHALLNPALGVKMEASGRLATLLAVGLDLLTHGGDLPDELVQGARRETFKESTDDDRTFLRLLKHLLQQMQNLNDSSNTPHDLLGLLTVAARLHGHELEGTATRDKERVAHPNATGKDGRVRVVKFLRFKQVLPDMVDDWLVPSKRLGYSVATANWVSAHAALDEEEGQLGMQDVSELDGELYTAPINVGDQRCEKLDAAALDTEYTRLKNLYQRGRLTDRDKRWLDWIMVANEEASPADANGVRLLTVSYGKSSTRVIGRRTATHPSMQHCPSGLRPLIVSRFYHDVDMVNCHPTLMLQTAEKMNVPSYKIQKLREYVTHRQPMLVRIGEHYGIPAAKAKYGVLRVLNGGSIAAWINDSTTGCSRNKDTPQADLRDLEEVARVVRDTFFAMLEYKERVEALRTELTATTKAKVAAAEARVQAASAGGKEQARLELGNARRKASTTAIERSLLSACLFELEDMVLMVIVKSFEAGGWTVSSFQFDGLHAEHRTADSRDVQTGKWVKLEAAMRAAERAVEGKLSYKIQLTEKALFDNAR